MAKTSNKEQKRPVKVVKNSKSAKKGISNGKRYLLDTQIPTSEFVTSGDSREMTVVGREVLDTLFCSLEGSKVIYPLNPALDTSFPRLSGFARQFERYRFRDVTIEYYSACPATRSGAVGVGVVTDPLLDLGQVPASLPEFASFEYAAAGNVGSKMVAPTWIPKDPEHFFIGSVASNESNMLKVQQGTVMAITRDSTSSDDATIAGYVAIRYKIDFFNMRPTLPTGFLTDNTVAQAVSTVSILPNTAAVHLGSITNASGYIDLVNDLQGGHGNLDCWENYKYGKEVYFSFNAEITGVPPLVLMGNKVRDREFVVVRDEDNKSEVSEETYVVTQRFYGDDDKQFVSTPDTKGDISVYLCGRPRGASTTNTIISQWDFNSTSAGAFTSTVSFTLNPTDFPSLGKNEVIQLYIKILAADTGRSLTNLRTSWVYVNL